MGYSLKQLEDALVGANTLNSWKNNIKSKYDNKNESKLDNIFNQYK